MSLLTLVVYFLTLAMLSCWSFIAKHATSANQRKRLPRKFGEFQGPTCEQFVKFITEEWGRYGSGHSEKKINLFFDNVSLHVQVSLETHEAYERTPERLLSLLIHLFGSDITEPEPAFARRQAEPEETEELGDVKTKGCIPVAEVLLGGRKVECLLDTGSQVSLITEKCYQQRFRDFFLLINKSVRFRGAFGANLHMLGYFITEVNFGSSEVENCAIYVFRPKSQEEHPNIIGTNVLADVPNIGTIVQDTLYRNTYELI